MGCRGGAGLAASRTLSAAGIDAVIVDRGRSVGGRLATRRIGGATVDQGAQFFTVRDDCASTVADVRTPGLVHEWCRGFDEKPDGYPRYAVSGGMNQLAKHFADGLRLLLNTRIESAAIEEPVVPSGREIEHEGVTGLPLVFAGDLFAGAKVEGAFRSGRAAGDYLFRQISPTH